MPRRPTNQRLYDHITSMVRRSVSRWPSAYASGMVVQRYTKAMKRRGLEPYVGNARSKRTGLTKWFDERWVDVLHPNTPCGSVRSDSYYPTCRPLKIARAMSAANRKTMASLKQQAGPRTATRNWNVTLRKKSLKYT